MLDSLVDGVEEAFLEVVVLILGVRRAHRLSDNFATQGADHT